MTLMGDHKDIYEGDIYIDNKGNQIEILTVAIEMTTGQNLIIYKHIDGFRTSIARGVDDFKEKFQKI